MLVETLAEVLYISDAPAIEWRSALDEDRIFYMKVAEVVVDTVVSYLNSEDEAFDGALRLASQLLSNDAELSRLNRTRRLTRA
jgi:hypothetical protein